MSGGRLRCRRRKSADSLRHEGSQQCDSPRTYKIHAPGTDTYEMAFACAAITVPNMMIVETIAANTKPAVFILIPLIRNTQDGAAGYALVSMRK